MKQIPFDKVILPPASSPAGIEEDRCRLIELAGNDRSQALGYFQTLAGRTDLETGENRLSAASVYQIGAWLQVGEGAYNAAIGSIVRALSLLAEVRNPDKPEKEEMKAMAAALLYDYAIACHAINSNVKAGKALAKSAKLYNSLSRSGKDRFFEQAAIVASASTLVYKSRLKQLNALAHHQAATEYYEGAIKAGEKSAMADLIVSITKEAEILLAVGRFRTAVRYFTKAVRYQHKLSGKFDAKELRLSLKLAEALLYVPLRRETGLKLIAALRKSAETMGLRKELEQIRQLEEREKLIHFNLVTFVKNLII